MLFRSNSVLKLMAATLLAEGEHTLRNVPDIVDVGIMSELLAAIGVRSELLGGGVLRMVNGGDLNPVAPYELVERIRASINVLGPLLGRCGRVSLSLPGGDDFGSRPIDMHLKGLEAMGATFELRHGVVEAVAETYAFECFACGVASFVGGDAAVQQAVGHVVECRHTFHEEELLEHEPEQVRAHGAQLAVAHLVGVHPREAYAAAGGAVEGADDVEQGRLARARGAHDADHLSGVDAQVHTGERMHGRLAGVGLHDVDQLEGGFGVHAGTTTVRPSFTWSPVTETKPLA